jgi:hypothetical protein
MSPRIKAFAVLIGIGERTTRGQPAQLDLNAGF